ncbi:MAG: uroporphyrinogen-III C-methyltransferase [Eubacteriaceae bacterium]|nr:uroporphyrinogen-III C-methyltransferase [Eubacteriaceae bacterium]
MKGKVYLVGAGPGDYKLITLKGLQTIEEADVVVYDRLVGKELLKYAKSGCEFIYVGKESSNHTKTQDEINDIICDKALEGLVVTRLKGGDPYVFGRGGEEGEYLVDRGVEVEVVPGITSAIGGLAYGGIPITHRDHASSFHVITGHLKDEDSELDWPTLAKLKGTLVFLMGMAQLDKIANSLIANGMEASTPAAIVNWASTKKQRAVTGTLETIYKTALDNAIGSPGIIVVGSVVNLREKLNFFENKPLFGKKILVTRAREQASSLTEKIHDLGGEAVEFPTISIKDISPQTDIVEQIKNLKDYSWLIFTSQNGVRIFFENLFKAGFDVRQLSHIKIAVIGKVTADELMKYSLKPDIIPAKYIAESIYEEILPLLKPEDKILIPRAKEARDYLTDQLKKHCVVQEVKIYETIIGEGIQDKDEIVEMLENNEIDYVTFTSSSTVKNLIKILGDKKELLKKSKLVSIGPVTSETIRDNGFLVSSEAEVYDIPGMIEVLGG